MKRKKLKKMINFNQKNNANIFQEKTEQIVTD